MASPIDQLIADKIKKKKKFRFININPGFNRKFGHLGHHQHQNLHFKNKVITNGGDFLSLSSQDLNYHDKFRNIPTFSYTPWKLIKEGDSKEFYSTFGSELKQVLELINHIDNRTKNIFFMYMADIRLIPTFLDFARSLKNSQSKNFFFLNLFHSHRDFFPEGKSIENINEELFSILKISRKVRNDLNIFLFSETEILHKKIFEYTQEELLLLPQFHSAFSEKEFNVKERTNIINRQTKKFTVFYPTATIERGLEFFIKIILYLAKKDKISTFRFVTRNPHPFNPINKSLLEKIKNFVELKEGAFSDDEYHRIFSESDAILLPYKKEEFFAKSSGIYTDAIIAEKPVMVTKETWLGRKTIENKNGLTFSSENLESFSEALMELKNNYEYYFKKCISIKSQWLMKNNLDIFFNIINNSISDEKNSEKEKNSELNNNIIDILQLLQNNNCSINLLEKKLSVTIKNNDSLCESLNQRISEKEKAIEKLQKLIKKKNDTINEKTEIIKKLRELNLSKNQIVKERTESLQLFKLQISEKEETIGKLQILNKNKNETLKEKTETLSKLKESLNNKNTIIATIKENISNKELMQKNIQLSVEKLQKELKIKNNNIAKLENSIRELNTKLNSFQNQKIIKLMKKLKLLK